MRPFATIFLFLLLSGACDPGAVTMNLLVYDLETDSYRFKDVKVRTLTDVGRLQGEATNLYGGAKLTLNYQDNYLKWHDKGHSVAFRAIEKDGVLVPEDYDSLAMASIYYNIELSKRFFHEDLGLDAEALTTLPTFYWADLMIVNQDSERQKMRDNAIYMFMGKNDRAFFVMPFDEFQWIPMSLNAGIIAHEYTHAVFDMLVMRLEGNSHMSLSGANFLHGINEGSADYMAAACTGDPSFMRHSIAEGLFVAECNHLNTYFDIVRDVSISRDYTDYIDDPARETSTAEFCPYDIGTFWAALLYEIALSIDEKDSKIPSREARTKVAGWLLGAMIDLGEDLSLDFEVWDIITLFVRRINSDSKSR